MSLTDLIQGQSHYFGITFLKGEELSAVLVKKSANRCQVVTKVTISLSGAGPGFAEEMSKFRSHITSFKSHSPTWVHMVLRNVSFVKVFSLTNISVEDREETVSKRIRSEIPYLAEEVILHQQYEQTKDPSVLQVLVFGVSKTVLIEQMKKLETFGVVPERVVLTTEVLNWMYRNEVVDAVQADYSSMLIHLFEDQLELLFYEGPNLLQSRWVEKSQEPAVGVRDAVDSSIASFQREWRRKPNDAVFIGIRKEESSAIMSDTSVIPKFYGTEESQDESVVAPLFRGVIETSQTSATFDYTLTPVKEAREKEGQSKKLNRVLLSAAIFAFTLFLFTASQVLSLLIQMGWYQARIKMLSSSVGEVKALREKALGIMDYQDKKKLPVILPQTIRKYVLDNLFLTDLEFDQKERNILLKGTVTQQSDVDQFLSALEKDPLFERLNLEGVQADRGEQGKSQFNFVIKGYLKPGVNSGR